MKPINRRHVCDATRFKELLMLIRTSGNTREENIRCFCCTTLRLKWGVSMWVLKVTLGLRQHHLVFASCQMNQDRTSTFSLAAYETHDSVFPGRAENMSQSPTHLDIHTSSRGAEHACVSLNNGSGRWSPWRRRALFTITQRLS